MNEPTFDADGYPTEETLEAIRSLDSREIKDYIALMDFVGRAWSYPDRWQKTEGFEDEHTFKPVTRYLFSTGGWSGNESLVEAMEDNVLLQMLGPWSWRRGGHYEYRL